MTSSPHVPESSPWMLTDETARYLRLSKKTIFRLLRQGLLRGYQPSGVNGYWRIHRDDADAWIRGGRPARRRSA